MKQLGKFVSYLFIEGVLIYSFLMLLQVDWIVHNVLYEYDLKFSPVWAVPYWTFIRTIMGALGLAMAVTAIISYVEYRRTKKLAKITVYLCEFCGNAWTRDWIGLEAEAGRKSEIKIIKRCPSCDKNLLDKQPRT